MYNRSHSFKVVSPRWWLGSDRNSEDISPWRCPPHTSQNSRSFQLTKQDCKITRSFSADFARRDEHSAPLTCQIVVAWRLATFSRDLQVAKNTHQPSSWSNTPHLKVGRTGHKRWFPGEGSGKVTGRESLTLEANQYLKHPTSLQRLPRLTSWFRKAKLFQHSSQDQAKHRRALDLDDSPWHFIVPDQSFLFQVRLVLKKIAASASLRNTPETGKP